MRGKNIPKGEIAISIAGQINRIKGNITSAYTALEQKGAALPSAKNSANLGSTIYSIETGITPSGSKSINANGTYDVTEYAQAIVNVTPALVQKAVTANGTYAASSDNADGYSNVTVNVPQGSQNSICAVKAVTDSASGWITFANADPTIAAHRADARFTIGIIALSAQQPKAAFLGAISGNVNFAANYTALTNPIYGLYMRSSSSGIVGSVQSNSILTENAAAGSVYVSEDGAIKAYSSSTYPICEGAYLIVCGW